MNISIALAVTACITIAGCASSKNSELARETPECMNYRSMMTAPMPPDAMERLRQACEQSRHNKS